MTPVPWRRLGLWAALGGVWFAAFFLGLGAYGILNDNEGLYAEVAREMLESGRHVIPTLNYVPYVEKPPLLYWLIAASYRAFGVTPWAARLVSALSALLLCIGVVYFGRRLGRPRLGVSGALILASSVGFAAMARLVMFDMLLTAFLGLALLAFYLWYEEGTRAYLRLAYVLLGLSVLAKGLVAIVLAVLTVLAFLGWDRAGRRGWRELFDPVGVVILLLVALPWHVAALLADPRFGWFYFVNEHVLRVLGLRVPHDFRTGPPWFHLPRILLGFLPWTPVLIVSAWRPRGERSPRGSLEAFLWIWVSVVVLFFSASQAKADYYTLPAMPALALLLAGRLEAWTHAGRGGALRAAAAVGFGVTAAGLLYIALDAGGGSHGALGAYVPAAVAALGTLAALGWAWHRVPTAQPVASVLPLAGLVLAFVLTAEVAVTARQDRLSEVTLAREIAARGDGRPLILYRDFETLSSLLFYTHRRIPIVETKSKDLWYGMQSPQARGGFLSTAEFAQLARAQRLYVVVRASREEEFRKTVVGAHFCWLAAVGAAALYSNDPAQCTPYGMAADGT